MEIKILDGADTIGGTKLYLDAGRSRLLLDFGINYKRFGMYFEEYLKPRSSQGLADLWQLGLIPPHPDLYRSDLRREGFAVTGEDLAVELVLLSHPHMDHCGLLGVLRPEIPVCASPAGWAVLKAMQDAGKAEFYAETTYVVPRVRQSRRALATADWKSSPAQGREIRFIAGEAGPELREFLASPANPSGRGLEPAGIRAFEGRVGGHDVRAFPVDHSVPGSLAYAVETDAGWVVYTGDLRLHGREGEKTRRFVEAARALRPAVLLIEGTRANRAERENPTEESALLRAHAIVVRSEGKLVLADFSARQVERLQGFLDIAASTGRRLAVLAKDMYLLEALARCDGLEGVLDSAHLAVYDDVVVNPDVWNRNLRERHRARLVGPDDVRADPGAFILAFSFWDAENLLDIRPAGGVYIYSSSEAHGEEQAMDMHRLWNWLRLFGIEVHGFAVDAAGELSFGGGLHASGHASGDEFLWMAREIGPRIVVPLHTERPALFTDGLRGEPIEVRLVSNGGSLYVG
jgi:ribonuclease J